MLNLTPSNDNNRARFVNKKTGQPLEIVHIEERQGLERILVAYDNGDQDYLDRRDLAVCFGLTVSPERVSDMGPA